MEYVEAEIAALALVGFCGYGDFIAQGAVIGGRVLPIALSRFRRCSDRMLVNRLPRRSIILQPSIADLGRSFQLRHGGGGHAENRF